MDLEPYRKMFFEDAAPIIKRVEAALLRFDTLTAEERKVLCRDAHTLKGGYLQFEMPEEAKWAAEIEKKASVQK